MAFCGFTYTANGGREAGLAGGERGLFVIFTFFWDEMLFERMELVGRPLEPMKKLYYYFKKPGIASSPLDCVYIPPPEHPPHNISLIRIQQT